MKNLSLKNTLLLLFLLCQVGIFAETYEVTCNKLNIRSGWDHSIVGSLKKGEKIEGTISDGKVRITNRGHKSIYVSAKHVKDVTIAPRELVDNTEGIAGWKVAVKQKSSAIAKWAISLKGNVSDALLRSINIPKHSRFKNNEKFRFLRVASFPLLRILIYILIVFVVFFTFKILGYRTDGVKIITQKTAFIFIILIGFTLWDWAIDSTLALTKFNDKNTRTVTGTVAYNRYGKPATPLKTNRYLYPLSLRNNYNFNFLFENGEIRTIDVRKLDKLRVGHFLVEKRVALLQPTQEWPSLKTLKGKDLNYLYERFGQPYEIVKMKSHLLKCHYELSTIDRRTNEKIYDVFFYLNDALKVVKMEKGRGVGLKWYDKLPLSFFIREMTQLKLLPNSQVVFGFMLIIDIIRWIVKILLMLFLPYYFLQPIRYIILYSRKISNRWCQAWFTLATLIVFYLYISYAMLFVNAGFQVYLILIIYSVVALMSYAGMTYLEHERCPYCNEVSASVETRNFLGRKTYNTYRSKERYVGSSNEQSCGAIDQNTNYEINIKTDHYEKYRTKKVSHVDEYELDMRCVKCNREWKTNTFSYS